MTLTEFNAYAPADLLSALVGPEGELNIVEETLQKILDEAERYTEAVYASLPEPQRKRLTALEALYQLFLRQGQYDLLMRIVQLREAELAVVKTYRAQSTVAESDPQIFTDEERSRW